MPYQLKDQDTTPPQPALADARSVTRDGLAAVAMVVLTAGLIALLIVQVV